jgi:hypothetical protein
VAQQDAYASSQGNIALNLIGVYKALGGGWEVRLGAGQQLASPAEAVPPPGMVDPAGEGQEPRLPDPPDFSMQEGADLTDESQVSIDGQPKRFVRLVSYFRPVDKD